MKVSWVLGGIALYAVLSVVSVFVDEAVRWFVHRLVDALLEAIS